MKHQVFVSSTFLDLKEERTKIITTLLDLDCIPAGMEYFPAIDKEQFEFIKRVIDESDYYVIVTAGRYGSVNNDGISYTELEYDYAVSKGIPIIALVKENFEITNDFKTESDNSKREKLRQFVSKINIGRIVRNWTNSDNLAGTLATSLSHTKKIFPTPGWIRAGTVSQNEVLEENHKLRKKIEQMNLQSNEAFKNTMKFMGYFSNYVLQNTSPASNQDYKKWLKGYKKAGGKVSENKGLMLKQMRTAETDLYLPPLHGSASCDIIVMPNFKVIPLDKDFGHSNFYYMQDYKYQGSGLPYDL